MPQSTVEPIFWSQDSSKASKQRKTSRRSKASISVKVPQPDLSRDLPEQVPSQPKTIEEENEDVQAMVREMCGSLNSQEPEVNLFKSLTEYFMGFWNASHAAKAIAHLERRETKRTVRALQKVHGFWSPPPDVAEALKSPPMPLPVSNIPDTKDSRNLRFVLKILGCSLDENRPLKQFFRARTLRQKRYWLYKYQNQGLLQDPNYVEPVCGMRLKRLYRFFPDRFTADADGLMYFNDQTISHDKASNLFYIGRKEAGVD